MELFIILGIIAVSCIFIYLFIWHHRRAFEISLQPDWEMFLEARHRDDIDAIILYTRKLIWNPYLRKTQLEELSKVVNAKVELHPEMEGLKWLIYKKEMNDNHKRWREEKRWGYL